LTCAHAARKPKRAASPGCREQLELHTGNEGSRFFFIDGTRNAPKLKVAAMEVGPGRQPGDHFGGGARGDTIDGASIVGGKLITSYLADAKSEISVHNLQGKKLSAVELPGIALRRASPATWTIRRPSSPSPASTVRRPSTATM
jgi:hypothetical protein